MGCEPPVHLWTPYMLKKPASHVDGLMAPLAKTAATSF